MIRLQVIEGRNTSGQIAVCVFQSFSVEVQTNAGYMRRMRNYNLEIRITDSSCRPQLRIPRLQDFIFPTYGRYIPLISRGPIRTVNYGPSLFPSIYSPNAKRAGHKSMEKNEDPLV